MDISSFCDPGTRKDLVPVFCTAHSHAHDLHEQDAPPAHLQEGEQAREEDEDEDHNREPEQAREKEHEEDHNLDQEQAGAVGG